MDFCDLWYDSICFRIGKGITSFVKGMFLGAIDGYKHPEKYPNHLSKEEQRRQRHREERARQKDA